MSSQSVWITYKAVSDNKHVRVNDPAEFTSQSPQSHRKQNNLILAIPVEFETALLQQLFILKGKLLSEQSFLLHRSDWSANIPGARADQLLPQGNATAARAPGKWPWHSRKEFISALGSLLIHTHLRCMLPEGGLFRWCRPDDLGHGHEDSLVGTLCSAIAMRVMKSWNHCF